MPLDTVLGAMGDGVIAAGAIHGGMSMFGALVTNKTISETISSRPSMAASAALGALVAVVRYDPSIAAMPLNQAIGAGVAGAGIGAFGWPVTHALLTPERVQDKFKERALQGAFVAGTASAALYAAWQYF